MTDYNYEGFIYTHMWSINVYLIEHEYFMIQNYYVFLLFSWCNFCGFLDVINLTLYNIN